MAIQRKVARDPFAFSLHGLSAMASFTAPVIVADDRLKQPPQHTPHPRPEPHGDWQPVEQPGC